MSRVASSGGLGKGGAEPGGLSDPRIQECPSTFYRTSQCSGRVNGGHWGTSRFHFKWHCKSECASKLNEFLSVHKLAQLFKIPVTKRITFILCR